MTWVSRHELAAAVSEAGGLGTLGAGGMDPEELRDEIRSVRAKTERPFAVNVPLVLVRPDQDQEVLGELLKVVRDEAVPVVVTGGGSPARYTPLLKEAGHRVMHVVPSVRLALKAEVCGVDAVVAEGWEAGGHIAANGLSSLTLIPQVVDAVSLPVVAAGGIADGRGVAAALALGACAVQLGTRFIATLECNAHPAFKHAVLAADAEGAAVYCRDYHASRALRSPLVERLIAMEAEGRSLEEILNLRGRHRARQGCIEGNLREGILPAGSGVGLVSQIVSVAELMRELTEGCDQALREAVYRRSSRPWRKAA